jgi:ATP synthase protein I
MTHVQASGPVPTSPFSGMLRATVIPMVAMVPVIVAVFWIARGTRGGLAALVGVVIFLSFFGAGLYLMSRVINASPLVVLSGAVVIYLCQVIALGVVVWGLSRASWLDSVAFAISVLVAVIAWQILLMAAFARARRPVYDTPALTPPMSQ